jgi:hypothetical protein
VKLPIRYLIFAGMGPAGGFLAWIAIIYLYGMVGTGLTPQDAARRFGHWIEWAANPYVIFWLVASALPACAAAALGRQLGRLPTSRTIARVGCAVSAILLISPWTMYEAMALYRSNWLAFCVTFAGSAISFAFCSWLSDLLERRGAERAADAFA